ncbi:hypothetical protein U0070_025597 [Myodes glareolus]|uniref:Uncharacterized protein n=1 Tax=Myodes glareolus TaxID=447135 RepID=A0AAW0I541_MYOGA
MSKCFCISLSGSNRFLIFSSGLGPGGQPPFPGGSWYQGVFNASILVDIAGGSQVVTSLVYIASSRTARAT